MAGSSSEFFNFPIAFLINLSKYYGFPPSSKLRATDRIFDLRNGIFVGSAPLLHQEYLTEETSEMLHQFLGANFDSSSSLKLEIKGKSSSMINYFSIHIENLRNIQSHIVLEETFNV